MLTLRLRGRARKRLSFRRGRIDFHGIGKLGRRGCRLLRGSTDLFARLFAFPAESFRGSIAVRPVSLD